MAILLDKKERVYDIEMTSYGKYLLSIGQYKPDSYAFSTITWYMIICTTTLVSLKIQLMRE